MTTPEERADESHDRALRRQWTIHDGRRSDRHVGSWADIYDVLDKAETGERLTRTERRVLAKYKNRIDAAD